MYPLNLQNPQAGGYAVASDETEHQALTAAGYVPPYVEPMPASDDDDDPVKLGPGRPRKVE